MTVARWHRAGREIEEASVNTEQQRLVESQRDGSKVGSMVEEQAAPPISRKADIFELHDRPALDELEPRCDEAGQPRKSSGI
jgi:hypothetical protein